MPNTFTQEDLFSIRRRVLTGESISNEEMRQVVAFLRADRLAAKPVTKAAVKKPQPTSQELQATIANLFGK